MSEEANRADALPADRASGWWWRVKEHRIAQWSVGYVAVAYGIQHAVTLTSEAYEWPNIVSRLSMTLLALGLPVAMTLAYYHGERVSRRISAGEMAIVSVMLVGISFAFYLFIRPAADIGSRAPAAQEASVTAARQAAANPHGAISIAVLPFVNLSSDKEQEFFSDGMTEEITAALAKVPDLKVVARTSAFEFKGKNVNIKTMGEQLGATHLIEGSVRKAGNRLRITAQLIKTDDGTHVWAEDYDRELTDVFAIQEDIARAITGSLNMSLGLAPGDRLVHGTQSPGVYQDYLQAKAWLRDRNGPRRGPYLKTLESVVARDPGFAPAWATLSRAYAADTFAQEVQEGPIEPARRIVEATMAKARMTAQKAIDLDPQHPGGYMALATASQYEGGRYAQTEDLFLKALALDPNDPEALTGYAGFLLRVGRIKESLVVFEKLRTLDPLVRGYQIGPAQAMLGTGQYDDIIRMLEAIPQSEGYTFRDIFLARAYAAKGRFSDAADLLNFWIEHERPGSLRPGTAGFETVAKLLRSAPAKAKDPKALPSLGKLGSEFSFVYLYIAPERFLDYYDRELQIHFLADFGKAVWVPDAAVIRKTPRFKKFVRDAGLVAYWRERGWPEFCHPTTGDDFACE